MTTHAPSLARTDDIPKAAVSEVKLVSETPDAAALVGAAAPELDADWPTLSLLSRRYIDRALQFTHGNKTRAADLLGIDRRTLNRILARDRARRAKPAAPPVATAKPAAAE
jgi:Fis family transcriptional regulator